MGCIIFNYIVLKDSPIACLSALFGILYTIYAGKGRPVCYLFGLSGSGFYSYLAFNNLLWGNLGLYICYYIPMQILGIINWNKHLKPQTQEIYKTYLSKKERGIITLISLCLFIIISLLIRHLCGSHPYMDGIITACSITGMYLTVRRCIEQWVCWSIVNLVSILLWLNLAFGGEKVFSTVLMWIVYLLLGVYFYIMWSKELLNKPKTK